MTENFFPNERTKKKKVSHPYICLDIKSVWFFVRRKTSFSLRDRERTNFRTNGNKARCACVCALCMPNWMYIFSVCAKFAEVSQSSTCWFDSASQSGPVCVLVWVVSNSAPKSYAPCACVCADSEMNSADTSVARGNKTTLCPPPSISSECTLGDKIRIAPSPYGGKSNSIKSHR